MERFNLDEYIKNPSKKVVTRDGKSVRIRCTDRKDAVYPIVALIDSNGKEEILSYTKNGYFYYDGRKDVNDLFFAPEKHEGWANIYGKFLACDIFSTKEEAEEYVKRVGAKDFAATAKIEWEE